MITESEKKNHLHWSCINFQFIFKYLCVLVWVSILPILAVGIAACVILKETLNALLKLKYGKDYGGILKSGDAIWTLDDISYSILNILVTLKYKPVGNETIKERMIKTVTRNIFNNSKDTEKLRSIREKLLGYQFLLKNQVKVEDCVFTLNTERYPEFTETALQEIISEYANKPLAKDNSTLWEINVSDRPLSLPQQKPRDADVYVILFRCNHMLGDGMSMTNMLLKKFDANQDFHSNGLFAKTVFSKTSNISKVSGIDIVKKYLYHALVSPVEVIPEIYLRKNDHNALHGPKLSGKKILTYVLQEDDRLFRMVKSINKAVPRSRFSDVILAGISASLDGYHRKNHHPVPKLVSVVNPLVMTPPRATEELVLANDVNFVFLKLPVNTDNSSMTKRLQEVAKSTEALRNSSQPQVTYMILLYLSGILPRPILKPVLDISRLTMTFSNVPGIPNVTIMGNCEIQDIIFYTPQRTTNGLGFCCTAYGNKLQLGMIVDKAILPSREEAQNILNDVVNYIKVLHEEVKGQKLSTNS